MLLTEVPGVETLLVEMLQESMLDCSMVHRNPSQQQVLSALVHQTQILQVAIFAGTVQDEVRPAIDVVGLQVRR